MSRRVTEGTVTPPYDVDNDVQYDGCQYIGTYTSHREFTLTRFRDILPEMQQVRVCTCCYCHDEKRTMIYDLRWSQRSDVTVLETCIRLIYLCLLIDLELLRTLLLLLLQLDPYILPVQQCLNRNLHLLLRSRQLRLLHGSYLMQLCSRNATAYAAPICDRDEQTDGWTYSVISITIFGIVL